MEYVQLGDLIAATKTNRCGDNDFPVLSITKNEGIILQSEKFKKRIASKDTADYKVVHRGQLVQGIHIDEANFGIQEVVDIGIVSPAYKIWDIKSNAIVPKYLEIILRSPRSIAYYASRFNGSIKRRERLSDKDFLQMKIPCPPVEEQIYAINVLDKAAALIEQRKQQLMELDNLIKARFVEMFGDPMTNPKGFPCYTVGEVIDFQGGSQPDKKYFEYEPTPDNIRLIQIRDYKSDKYITYIPRAMAKRFCTADDIMIGRYGPPIFQILKGIEGSFNVALMKATPKMGNREFVRQFLKQDCLLEYLEGLSKRTAGQDGIQMDKLKTYPFPYPPIELQEQFAAFVEQVDKSKVVVQKALDKAQTLFDSLMQKYFG